MLSILFLGFMIGMRHALEADHVAAVVSLGSNDLTTRNFVRHGVVWGAGHSTTLLIIGSIILSFDQLVSSQVSSRLEFVVGILLIVLGLNVIYRSINGGNEGHGSNTRTSSESMPDYQLDAHSPTDFKIFPSRSFFVGLVHGVSGSAALTLFVLSTMESTSIGVLYLLLFGIGSIVGMSLLVVAISFPLKLCVQKSACSVNFLQVIIGTVTSIIGGKIAITTFAGI